MIFIVTLTVLRAPAARSLRFHVTVVVLGSVSPPSVALIACRPTGTQSVMV